MSHLDFENTPFLDDSLYSFIKESYNITDWFILYRNLVTTNNKNYLLAINNTPFYVIKIYKIKPSKERIFFENLIHKELKNSWYIDSPEIIENSNWQLISIFNNTAITVSHYLKWRASNWSLADNVVMARGLFSFHTESKKHLTTALNLNIKCNATLSLYDIEIIDYFTKKKYTKISQMIIFIQKAIWENKNLFTNWILHWQYSSWHLSFWEKLHIFDFEEIWFWPIITDVVYAAYKCGYKDRPDGSIDWIYSFLEHYKTHSSLNNYENHSAPFIILLCFITDLYIMLNEKDRLWGKWYDNHIIYLHYQELIKFYKNLLSQFKQ